jgi:endo-1,4-beta-xylanase
MGSVKRMKTGLFLTFVPLMALGSLIIVPAGIAPTVQEPTLAKAFESDFRIGAALGGAVINGRDAISTPLVESQFNSFTGENCMKPEAIQKQEGVFSFGDADKLAAIAEKRGATLVGHTLVWHSQTPPGSSRGWTDSPLPVNSP